MPEKELTFWQRAKMAVNFTLRGSVKRSNKAATPYSTISYNGTPQKSFVNYENFYQEGFNENAMIYAAITYKAKAITQSKLKAYQYLDADYRSEEIDRKQPISQVLLRPNQYQSGDEFHSLQNVFFNLTGNAFTFIERDRSTQEILKLWPLNPLWVSIIPDKKGEIKGYEYQPTFTASEPLPILPENMAHWKLPNPLDPLNGLGFGQSPLNAMASAGDVDNMISRFLNVFFKHGAMPPGILKFKDMALDENEIAEIREKWKEIYGGYSNWADIGVLDGMGEYQRIGLTFEEMNFEKLDQRNEARILSVLGVPVSLIATVSALQGSTYNNKSQDRKMFWEDTMMYELEVVEQELGRFFNTDEIFLKWDITEVKALKNDVNVQIDSARKLIEIGVPPITAFDSVGLAIAKYEGIEERLLVTSIQSQSMIENQQKLQADNQAANQARLDQSQMLRDDTQEPNKKPTEKPNQEEAKNNSFLARTPIQIRDKQSRILT